MEHMAHGLTEEREFNRFMSQFALTVTDPIGPQGVKPGWTRIERGISSRWGDPIANSVIGRQIPKRLHDDFVRHVDGVKDAHAFSRVMQDVANFYRTNLLTLNPGTVGTNAISGGLQYATMLSEHFWKGAVTLDMSRIVNDVKGLGDALRPSVIKERPEALFGARSNVRTQYDKPTTRMGKIQDAGMKPFAAVENFWKRAIAQSELRQRGAHKMTAEQIVNNRQLLHEVNRAVDTWAFNYAEVPKAIEAVRKHAGLIIPFPVYFYKIGRMYGRYVAGLNPAVKLSWQDRAARVMTLATMMAPVLYLASKTGEKTSEKGRLAVGDDLGARTVKYPWAALANPKTATEEGISVGPLGEGMADLLGYDTKYDAWKKPGVGLGETLGGFVPGSRITQSTRDIIAGARGEQRRQPQGFVDAFARSVPFVPTMGKKKGKYLDPALEALKFGTGVNLQKGHPRSR